MARLTPDPSFYPSPAEAAAGPPEKLAYVATLNVGTNGDRRPDAMTVVDVDPASPSYGEEVGRLEMPNVGDELHHFGWNACSSALCPWAAHPHVERRYLVVPGLRSSRIHILDVKDDPRQPRLEKVIEPEELARKAGYSRPHTSHCGPDGLYMSALGAPDGGGPGGLFLLDHEDFTVKGAWEEDRGPQELAYDFWWHINHGTVITSTWGTPKMVEDGLQGDLLLSNQYGHSLHVWDWQKRRHVQEIDLGAEHQMVLELRPAHNPRNAYGFVGVVTNTQDLSASIWLWVRADDGTVSAEKVISIDAEPAADADPAAGAAQAVRRRAPAGHRHRAQRRRPVAVRLLLGNGGAQALRRDRPAAAPRDGLRPAGRDRRPGRSPGVGPAQRRPPDGRGEP
jgi:selenium-binding protein 1